MITVFGRSYKIDKDALEEYGRTTQAGVVAPIIQGNANEQANGAILAKFLETVDGDGVCRVEYRHSKQYEEMKLGECGLTHSRVYPVAHYTCAFACLPLNLRVLALHSDYYAFGLSKCFHWIALGLTKNEESKRVLTEFLTSGGDRMKQIAEFYGKDYGTVKKWFRAFSNNKQKSNWLKENSLESTHEYIDEWIAVQNSLTDEFCKLYPKAFKALGRQKPTLRSYVNQCEEAKAREAMDAYFGNGLGPPMHDGISVLQHGLEEPGLIAEKLSEVVSEALGYKMIVHHEAMEPEQLQNMCAYSRTDVVSNHQFEYETKEEFKATLDALATRVSRFFVCMPKMETDAVVELEYSPNSDRTNKHIIRTSAKTTQTHPGTLIVTQVDRVEATDKDGKPILGPDDKPVFIYTPKKHEPLLSWYIKDARRREKHRIGVYFTEAEERKHPNDLNVSSGLPFDERFENEPPQERTAFADLFEVELDWKTLDGLDFLLWHLKFSLHDGDAVAFAYTIQLLAYSLQYRIKSGVLILFTGVQGTGKTAVFGQNESGPGIYMRIYGDCGMQYNNVETLLKDFNADAMGKLYCLLEEANPGKNTNNNNQLQDIITGGRQRIERKCIDPFHVDDYRSFVSCSQDVPFKIEQGDRRFVVNRTRDTFSPTGVLKKEITQEEFVEFGRKLDRIKNDNEVAYELFAMVMRLDLSGFDKTRLPVTAAKTGQQNETSCKVTAWIERVAKLEFYDSDQQLLEDYFDFEHDKIISLKTVRLSVLFQRYKIWYAAAYPGTWLEPRNENSFAKALIKIPDLVTMKRTKVCNLYTIKCPEYHGKEIDDELNDDDAEPEAKRQKSDF